MASDYAGIIAKRLTKHQKKLGLSIRGLAKQAGIPHSRIYLMTIGDANVTIKTIQRAEVGLGIALLPIRKQRTSTPTPETSHE